MSEPIEDTSTYKLLWANVWEALLHTNCCERTMKASDINSKCEHEKRRLVAGRKWAWKNKNKSNFMEQNVVRRCSLPRKWRHLLLRLQVTTISAKQFHFEDYYLISLWSILLPFSSQLTCLTRDFSLMFSSQNVCTFLCNPTRVRRSVYVILLEAIILIKPDEEYK